MNQLTSHRSRCAALEYFKDAILTGFLLQDSPEISRDLRLVQRIVILVLLHAHTLWIETFRRETPSISSRRHSRAGARALLYPAESVLIKINARPDHLLTPAACARRPALPGSRACPTCFYDAELLPATLFIKLNCVAPRRHPLLVTLYRTPLPFLLGPLPLAIKLTAH